MRRKEKLNEEQKEHLKKLCDADAALADARRLTQEFAAMVRKLEGEKLDGWLAEARCEALWHLVTDGRGPELAAK